MRRLTTEELEKICGVDRSSPEYLTDAGRTVIDPLLEELRSASKREAGALLRALLQDGERLEALAGLARFRPHYWSGSLAEIRELDVSSRTVRDLEATIRRLCDAGDRLEIPDYSHGLPKGFEPAEGYTVNDSGVYRARGEDQPERICVHHLAVKSIVVDRDSGERQAAIVWPRGSAYVPLADLGSTPALCAALGGAGAVVHAQNARSVARYLSESIWTSGSSLPIVRTSSRLGWIGTSFLLGDRHVGDQGLRIEYSGPDELRDATSRAGTERRWIAAVEQVAHRDAAWIAIYASVGSPLLQWFGLTQGYVVDFSGATSRGKTTILRLAASVWGRPDQSGLLRSWDATTNWIEAYASQLQSLPVLLDDTKQAKRKSQIAGVLYSHAYGQSKGRARPGRGARSVDTRDALRWLSILISTGEARITSYSEDEGARARCLCWEGAPLGSGEEAWRLTDELSEHYGHLGRAVIENLQGRPEVWRKRFRELQASWRADLQSRGGAVAGRLGTLLAVLETASELCRECGLRDAPRSPLDAAAEYALAGARDAERALLSLDDLRSHLLSRPSQIYGLADAEEFRRSPREWLGKVDREGRLCIVTTYAREWLTAHGHDAQAAFSRWENAGAADLNRKLQLGGHVVTMIRLCDPLETA